MSEYILHIEDLKKTFDGQKLTTNNISMNIKKGEIIALLGPSGCGKTTLLRLIAGFEKPDSGLITLYGQPVYASQDRMSYQDRHEAYHELNRRNCERHKNRQGMRDKAYLLAVKDPKHPPFSKMKKRFRRLAGRVGPLDADFMVPTRDRNIGYVVQEGVLFPHMTVYENIAYGLGSKIKKDSQEDRQIMRMLALTGIEHLKNRKPHELSGGEQQRVALARALAPEPPLILLDEPFSALDEHLRISIREEVMAIIRKAGATAIMVTHDREEAIVCADRIAVMWDGCLLQLDTPKSVYYDPVNVDTAVFVGETILLHAIYEQGYAHTLLGRVPLRNFGFEDGTVGQVMLRPEQIGLYPPDHSKENVLADLESVSFKGPYSEGLFTLRNSDHLVSERARKQLIRLENNQIRLRVDNLMNLFALKTYQIQFNEKGKFFAL